MSDYYENLEGSPYINEAAMDYINKLKNAGSNFWNKFKGNKSTKQTQELSNTDKDFIKIVEKISEMIIRKIDNDLKTNHKAKLPNKMPDDVDMSNVNKFVSTNKGYDSSAKQYDTQQSNLQNTSDASDDMMVSEDAADISTDTSGGGRLSKKPLAANEKKAGGWLNWFEGHYNKYRTFGLPLDISDVVKLSNGKSKNITLKWSNNKHDNKILVTWTNVIDNPYKPITNKNDLVNYNKQSKAQNASLGSSELEEKFERTDEEKKSGTFTIFKFYDDQINPKSPSYQSPSIALLLTQANRYSKIIDKIKNAPELQKLAAPLFDCFYEVSKGKWSEWKGHKINPEEVTFTLVGKDIKFDGVDGKPHIINPEMISSILSRGKGVENPENETDEDPNFEMTGLKFDDFIEKLKKAGFKSEDLKNADAKREYGEKTTNKPTSSIDKSKLAAWRYTIDNGEIIGPDPSGKRKSGSWKIEDTSSIPSDVIKIIHSDPEKSSEMKSEIERINNLKLQKEIPPSNDFSPEIEPTTGFSPFPEKKKNNIKKENIKEQYSLMNILNRSN